ncbi:hypothetical protein CRG98_015553 [Punica granatum]|uniref:Uncharacterized protein n=1 Tax=Punica granatum TaxID=22663 RepID=A0A2I0K641_PUNGR|nr:hypothetical protein CRG98_015553 [Punica granatum]
MSPNHATKSRIYLSGELGWAGLSWIGPNGPAGIWTGPHWADGPDWAELGWAGLSWIGPNGPAGIWTGPHWADGPDWAELGWAVAGLGHPLLDWTGAAGLSRKLGCWAARVCSTRKTTADPIRKETKIERRKGVVSAV